MKIDQWLREATNTLRSANIPTSRLDALVLLEDCTDKERAWLLAHPEFELTATQIKTLSDQIARRSKHEPLAYIRGKSEFYSNEFIVNNHTLEPRPETETMIDLLKQIISTSVKGRTSHIDDGRLSVVDVGTGSGAIAITTKLLFPETKVYATDIDEKCIQTAKTNAQKHQVNIDIRQGNLLAPLLKDKINEWIILANLPYVPDSHAINEAAMFEPKHAIFGGKDGLDFYREMFMQLETINKKPTHILTESLPFHHDELSKIAETAHYKQFKEEDFIQVFSLTQTS